MKTRTCVLIGVAVGLLILTCTLPMQCIDLHSESNESHTFGYWNSIYSMMTGKPPIKTVTIPIDSNNYIGNPSTIKFSLWLGNAVIDTSTFSYESYINHINK